MAKVQAFRSDGGEIDHIHWWCPGCKTRHMAEVNGHRGGADGNQTWMWNGDLEKPVVEPSVNYPGKCHFFVGSNGAAPGQIRFLNDCRHALAGHTVEMVDLTEEMW